MAKHESRQREIPSGVGSVISELVYLREHIAIILITLENVKNQISTTTAFSGVTVSSKELLSAGLDRILGYRDVSESVLTEVRELKQMISELNISDPTDVTDLNRLIREYAAVQSRIQSK